MSARPHDVILRSMDELAHDDRLNGNQRAIVLAVAAFAYEPVAPMSTARLVHVLNLTPDTIRQHLGVLEALGWVRFDRRARTVSPGPRIQRQHEAVAR